MPQEVRAAVAVAKGAPTEIRTVLVPDPGPGEALVAVQACGVCHTDLHYREGAIGCGGVGNAAIAGASRAGARRVIAIDVDDGRLDAAERFGATDTVNSRGTDPIEAVRSLTGGHGADVVIDAVGRPETYRQGFYLRDLAGTLVQVGVPDPATTIELPLIDLFSRGGALKSSWYGDCLPSRDFPVLIDLYLSGKLDLDRFVTATMGLDDLERAFAAMRRGEGLRSVITL